MSRVATVSPPKIAAQERQRLIVGVLRLTLLVDPQNLRPAARAIGMVGGGGWLYRLCRGCNDTQGAAYYGSAIRRFKEMFPDTFFRS